MWKPEFIRGSSLNNFLIIWVANRHPLKFNLHFQNLTDSAPSFLHILFTLFTIKYFNQCYPFAITTRIWGNLKREFFIQHCISLNLLWNVQNITYPIYRAQSTTATIILINTNVHLLRTIYFIQATIPQTREQVTPCLPTK